MASSGCVGKSLAGIARQIVYLRGGTAETLAKGAGDDRQSLYSAEGSSVDSGSTVSSFTVLVTM